MGKWKHLLGQFWNHSEQHSSKTHCKDWTHINIFWNHSEQHSSKTEAKKGELKETFWNHSEQHSSKTKTIDFLRSNKILEPFRTTQL